MRLCVFEDHLVENLEPITFTRPAFDLWCGASSLLTKQQRWSGAKETTAWIRAGLVEFLRLNHCQIVANDPTETNRNVDVWVNARWVPGEHPLKDSTPRVGIIRDQVAYVLGVAGPESYPEGLKPWLERCRRELPREEADGTMIDYLWELVDENPQALSRDWGWFHQERLSRKTDISVLGPEDQLVVAVGAEVEPFVFADTRSGPVMIEPGAKIQAFTRLEGPCYIGADSTILAAKLRGGTIGPCCRVGGEVEASIIHGYSNKYHDGFLGHSYVGEWVNLAAGTQTSDLRNDYGMVQVSVNGLRIHTGRTKVGSFIGDHTKTGLGALLNTGTSIGVFCNILPSGFLSPTVIPSFSQVNHGQLQDRSDLRNLFQTAAAAMRRRGYELTDFHKEFYVTLYEKTAKRRSNTMQELEIRRLRRSV